jgi:hypothetical protein
MANYQSEGNDSRIADAMNFLRLANEADSNNRSDALDDLRFVSGDQWPVEIQNSRNLEARPCLTINKLDAYCRQIANQQRQQRPRIKVHPCNSYSDKETAQVVEGICRHIEINSDADSAYDKAFESAVRMGWGYWRVVTDYTAPDSFDQEIYINPIENPFSVYFDPNSVALDGSDQERCLITTVMSKDKFSDLYPDADAGGNFSGRGNGDSNPEWVTKEDIRIAEYFYIERTPAKLYLLNDKSRLFKDQLPSKEFMAANGLEVVGERDSYKKVVKWCKLTAMEILEERDWPGKYIPVVPVYGGRIVIDSKSIKYGLVRYAKDPQKMYNFWQTSMTEAIALAPKAKWLLAEGQDEGHENEWAAANIKATPVLRYKQTDIEGRTAPVPTRLQPEPPPLGIMGAAESVSNDLQQVVGIFDPSQLPTGNISGKALNGQQQQTDMTNYHYYDNLTKSIAQTGRIILDLIPKIYDSERVMRIIGVDGKPDLITINEASQVGRVLNDVTVGEYDVSMDTGPGYASRRIQAVEAMMPLIGASPELFQAAGDLVFRQMDFPGAEIIADRLAAVNPLAQIDEKSDIPPQVQMQLAQANQQMQMMQQQMQAMQLEINNRGQVAQIKEEGANKRKLMEVTARAHNTETMAEVRVNDQNTRSITSQNKTEIDALVNLLIHNMPIDALAREIERRNAEQMMAAEFAVSDVDQGQNPFMQ